MQGRTPAVVIHSHHHEQQEVDSEILRQGLSRSGAMAPDRQTKYGEAGEQG